MRSSTKLISAVFLALSMCAPATSQDKTGEAKSNQWPGWRGIEQEGRSESLTGPIQWSQEQNIRWKTTIPGDGHSSPVVSQDRVFVTTAYSTETESTFNQWATAALILLAFCAFSLAASAVVRSCRTASRNQATTTAIFAFLVGVSSCLFIAGHLYLGASNSATSLLRWLFTIHAVSLCMMLATVQLPRGRATRRVVGLIAVLLPALVVLGRPEPGYFNIFTLPGTGEGWDLPLVGPVVIPSYWGRQILGTVAITLLIGLALLLKSFAKQEAIPSALEKREDRLPTGTFVARLTVASGAFIIGLGLPLVSWVYGRPSDLGSISAWVEAASEIRRMILLVGGCFIAWLIVDRVNLRSRESHQSPWFAVAILSLAGWGFFEKNFLSPNQTFARVIMCLDRSTGKVVWESESLHGPANRIDPVNSQASPTPVIDGDRVYAYFGNAGMMATDYDGNILWTNKDLPFGGYHGSAASPTFHDGIIVITNDGGESPYIAALDCKTGDRVWTRELPIGMRGVGANYRTPLIKHIEGRPVVVFWGWSEIKGYDLYSGEELWSYPTKRPPHEPVASMVSDDDNLYLAHMGGIVSLNLAKLGNGEDPEVWTQRRTNTQTVSPVINSEMLFVASDSGMVTCLRTETGEILWRKRSPVGKYFASLVTIGKAVYVFNDAGVTTVIASEAEYRKLAENDLADPILASPAPVDGQLFIRTKHYLWCIGDN